MLVFLVRTLNIAQAMGFKNFFILEISSNINRNPTAAISVSPTACPFKRMCFNQFFPRTFLKSNLQLSCNHGYEKTFYVKNGSLSFSLFFEAWNLNKFRIRKLSSSNKNFEYIEKKIPLAGAKERCRSLCVNGKTTVAQLPWGFRKAGRGWCGGARETHWATCHNGVTPSKTKELLKSPWVFRSQWSLMSWQKRKILI